MDRIKRARETRLDPRLSASTVEKTGRSIRLGIRSGAKRAVVSGRLDKMTGYIRAVWQVDIFPDETPQNASGDRSVKKYEVFELLPSAGS